MPQKLKSILRRTLICSAVISAILTTASCGMLSKIEDPTEGWTADKLYIEARDNLNEGNWQTARDYYQKLEARYPYGRYAQQAQVESAYSYFKEGEPQQAIQTCDRFLRQYPEHPLSPYALYIKGIATLDEDEGWMSFLTTQDLSKRDAQAARDAFDIFKELVQRFPNSRYANDARQRMHELVQAQAKYEVNTARYYFDRKAYLAAINRAQVVVTDFQTSDQVDEALQIMLESYEGLDMKDKAADIQRIIEANKNRPSFTSYEKAQEYHQALQNNPEQGTEPQSFEAPTEPEAKNTNP